MILPSDHFFLFDVALSYIFLLAGQPLIGVLIEAVRTQKAPAHFQAKLLVFHHRLPHEVNADMALVSAAFGRTIVCRDA